MHVFHISSNVHNVDVINISLSDHCAIGLRWKLGTSSGFSRHVTMEYKRPKNIVKHTVVPSVMHDLSTVNYFDSVNEKLSCFNNALISFQDSTFRKVVRRISRPSQPKWFNVRVKSEIEKRNYYKKHGLIELFKLQRNKVVNLIRFEKSSYYKNLLINAKGDCRKLWSNFKQALGKNISTPTPVLKINNSVLTDALETASAFNTYFTNISAHVTEKLPKNYDYIPSDDFIDFLSNKLEGVAKFALPYISEEKVLQYLNKLDERKATGEDNISVSLLHLAGINIVFPLCSIINCSIATSSYPSLWKVAKVFSLHKGGSTQDINNYMPISILSAASKIIEKHSYQSFYSYLLENQLLTDSQFGFRTGMSCCSCLTSIVDYWLSHINSDKIVGLITIDFRKAFDVLPHDILLQKLDLYGCDQKTVSWFKSYLTDRCQFVNVDKVSSDFGYLKLGVPQGSILGPLIFNLFINDLHLHIKFCNIFSYADDTNLTVTGDSQKILKPNLLLI